MQKLTQNNSKSHAARAVQNLSKPATDNEYKKNNPTESLGPWKFPKLPDPTPEQMLEMFPRNEDLSHYSVKYPDGFSIERQYLCSGSDASESFMRRTAKEGICFVFQVSLCRSGIIAGQGYVCAPSLHWTCSVNDRGQVLWLPLHSLSKAVG